MAQRRKKGRTPQENYAIKQKVDELVSQGIDEQRAIAAAFRMYRDKELDIKSAPNLTEEQQEIRRDYRRRRRLVRQPGSAMVDLSMLGGFAALYKRLKKGLK